MSAAPEIRRMVTREMIEAHYKSIMTTARTLMREGNTAHAYRVLSEAISLPYPIPAPATMPETAGRENLVSWSTEEASLLVDYFAHPAHERIAALEAALHPFVKHNSSEPTVTITVSSAAVTRARSLLAKGDTP